MRAKRSKKYRKLMHQYELAFGFREPYQVLVDANFLRAVDSFKMDLIPALERTLQGKVKPHAKKNKEHYILATADAPTQKKSAQNDFQQRKRKRDDEREEQQAMRRAKALRIGARSIPGVPIVYVKRSVMVLEPMSTPSDMVREGVENSKFRAGLNEKSAPVKRRQEGESSTATEDKKKRGPKKVKAPNPLSMKKPKKRNDEKSPSSAPKQAADAPREPVDVSETPDGDNLAAPKPKRRRRHNKSGPREGDEETEQPDAGTMEVDA
ncbi:uncharacterized protein PFLUO_LOCUS639 [Penicillium psychrofluorescens]|uniref:uncharacterized protein n=1 Tax=Penicillium psychrofluorescens TaxID=3158075 RepID=UPI003CCCEA68